jgi:hypothetical protein
VREDMYLDQKKILDSLTDEDIIKICAELGSPEYKRDSQGNLLFSTSICHGGDSPYKLTYYHDSHRFKCWTCSDSYGIIDLNKKEMEKLVNVFNSCPLTEKRTFFRLKEDIKSLIKNKV